jgi:hypothetical protein
MTITTHLSLRISVDLARQLRQQAEATNLTFSEYARALLELAAQDREAAIGDPDALFEKHLIEWWAYRGQGDPGQMVGAGVRAQAIGLSLASKLRRVLKQCIDHGLL